MIKILKTHEEGFNKVALEIEGYPHAFPVVDKDLQGEELQAYLQEWKTRQDEVDLINANARQ